MYLWRDSNPRLYNKIKLPCAPRGSRTPIVGSEDRRSIH